MKKRSQKLLRSESCFAFELKWISPARVFEGFAASPFVTFLESGGDPGERSRYSYLCLDPVETLRDASLDAVGAALQLHCWFWDRAPVPFAGGAAGFLGYEMGATLERVPRAPGRFDGIPVMQFGIYDLLFAWDHFRHKMWLLSGAGQSDPRATAALAKLADLPPTAEVKPLLQWQHRTDRATHMARVARALEYIRAGDIYQGNITASFEAPRPPDLRAPDIFLALRAANPAPFTAYIDCGNDCAIASVSPERFLSLDAAGVIEARPIKGTRPRGSDEAADEAEAAILLTSAKDRAENLMIVDLLRNDISRVALPGSVCVPSLCALESFPSVHHLVSVVRGCLRPDRDAIDLLHACFPGGSITGAPKLRAMEIIAELEGHARGPYCGSAAWLGFDGAMDSSILIRTVTVARERVIAQAGGGIVAESDPAEEWAEALIKITPVLRALSGE